MWNPFKRKPKVEPEEDTSWMLAPDPNRVLIAVSKPGKFSYTVKGKSGYSYDDTKVDVMVHLYMNGTKREWAVFQKGFQVQRPSDDMDFWATTGKFASDTTKDHFEWILSERQQKQELLKALIAMDPDPPKEGNDSQS